MLKSITNYLARNNSGYSAICMVIILLLLGSLLITELNRFSLAWQKKVIKEQQYYRDVNHSLSLITWATTVSWLSPTDIWQCQRNESTNSHACIRQAVLSNESYTIIRGQSNSIKQYHLATYQDGHLNIEKGHWLDYCPDKVRDNDCE